jgi:transcriptional regulator with XRE-family HTH domain
MIEKNILLELIKVSGLSQKEFSLKTGIPEPRISEWIQGKRNPKLSTLIDGASKIGLDVSWEIKKLSK